MIAASLFAHENQGDEHARHGPVKKEQTAWGIAGNAASASRTIILTMDDSMRFTPDKLVFRKGETVRFVIRNTGRLPHEIVMGTRESLGAHAAMMAKTPNMPHGEAYLAHVGAGRQGELAWTFNRSGEFDFACLVPGHFEAGMAGKISVATAAR